MKAILTVDLGFGDAGKGSIVDYLTRVRKSSLIVRYNGGAQAAHRVVDGEREHVFSQFGSGTFVPNVRTHLSEYMLVHPEALLTEANVLAGIGVPDALKRLTIHENAVVILRQHQVLNQLRELARGNARHGSCGMGIGEARSDALKWPDDVIRAKHLRNTRYYNQRLRWWFEQHHDEFVELRKQVPPAIGGHYSTLFYDESHSDYQELRVADDAFERGLLRWSDLHPIIFEGAQGVLLDEHHGFHPHVTWTDTTLNNAYKLLKRCDIVEVESIGITRAYSTRHGDGPLPSYDSIMTDKLQDVANVTNKWQGKFRVGPLDLTLLEYAAKVVGKLDSIAVTCLDRVGETIKVAKNRHGARQHIDAIRRSTSLPDRKRGDRCGTSLRFEELTYAELRAEIHQHTGAPVDIVSYGPGAEDKVKVSELEVVK